MKRVVVVSGYFNPIHIGHINLMAEAKKIGDYLVVIVNNDEQVKLKGSHPFMPELERIEIIKAIGFVDEVFLSVDKDKSVVESLKIIAKKYPEELYFANGADRNLSNIPEAEICQKLNIKTIDGVGGKKVQSSSWLLAKNSKN
jgi:cytidyltransferase-like protein